MIAARRKLRTLVLSISNYARLSREKSICEVALEVYDLTSKGSCYDYGAAKSLLKEAQIVYTWLTRDQVNYQVKLMKKELENHNYVYNSSSARQLLQSHSLEGNSNKGGRPKGATASSNLDIET